MRNDILINPNNTIIRAGAGRGKTTLLAKKIKYDSEINKDHRVFAAITFTNKAVDEIKNKIGNINGVISTVDSFIMQEIIFPFIHHHYGDEYKKENLERDFKLKESTFKKLLEKIKICSKIGVYTTQTKDFISELALIILQNSFVAQRYFKSKYYKIYIDEYQDVNKEQHNLFRHINEFLDIKLFILGDPQQNIYAWRGASSKGFYFFHNSPFFSQYELKINYRCHENIQKFLEIFEKTQTSNLSFNYESNVKFIQSKLQLEEILKENKEKEICILTRTHDSARAIVKHLKDFKYIPNDELTHHSTPYKWVTKEILHFILSEKSNEYNLINSIPFDVSNIMIKNLKIELKKLKNTSTYSFESIENIFNIIFSQITKDEIKTEYNLIQKIKTDSSMHVIYNMHNVKNLVMTMHSSKGMEFQIVIVFVETLFSGTTFDENLNYVSISRGKEKLIIYHHGEKEQYIQNLYSRLTNTQKILFKNNNISS